MVFCGLGFDACQSARIVPVLGIKLVEGIRAAKTCGICGRREDGFHHRHTEPLTRVRWAFTGPTEVGILSPCRDGEVRNDHQTHGKDCNRNSTYPTCPPKPKAQRQSLSY